MSEKAPTLAVVKMIVSDVDRVFHFYRDVFGVTQWKRVTQGEGLAAVDEILSTPLGGAGGPTLAIKAYPNKEQAPVGELQLGFLVSSVDEVISAAIRAGGSVAIPAHDQVQHGVRIAFLKDVEGHSVELIEIIKKD